MPRRDRQSLRLDDWPSLDEHTLATSIRQVFEQRRSAVQAYARGDQIEQIVATSSVNRSTLLRLVQRAEQAHPDGRLWGYRALVPHVRVQPYKRSLPARALVHTKAGNAGAFSQLLQRYPALMKQLRSEIDGGNVKLLPGGELGRLAGVKAAAGRFQRRCRELGLGAADYPFNQQDKAIRSLARTLKAWMMEDFDLAAHSAGARLKPTSALREQPDRATADAFDTVEFDAHKMDVRLKVIDRDPLGGEQSYEIERVWLLAIIDVATRCILGYTLCLQRECSRFDAIDTFKRALTPASAPSLTLPGLELLPSGGFVSLALAQTRHACWRQIRLDNARAHLAATSLDVICEALGCVADFGPAYSPDDRPFIERFFGTVTTTLSRRLPGALQGKATTAQPGHAALQRLLDPADTLRLMVTVQELEELLHVTVWNYHGTPHSGLGGLTPLEMMHRHVLGIGREPVRLRRLPQPLRDHPELLHDAHSCRVRGNVARGERPYITFYHVRYTSEQLSHRSDLIGQHLLIRFDHTDLRRLTASTPDGQFLQELLASGPWRTEAHSLRLRQQVFKAKRARTLDFSATDNPIEAFLALRRTQAPKRRRSASDIAQVQRERKAAALPPERSAPAPSEAERQRATGPIKGKPLRIARGFGR